MSSLAVTSILELSALWPKRSALEMAVEPWEQKESVYEQATSRSQGKKKFFKFWIS